MVVFAIVNHFSARLNFDERRVIMNRNMVFLTETQLKDHLGNTRVAIDRSNNALVVKQVNSYYPFGMNIKGLTSLSVKDSKAYSPNEYLYNGKKLRRLKEKGAKFRFFCRFDFQFIIVMPLNCSTNSSTTLSYS